MKLPRLYPIIDAGIVEARSLGVESFAAALVDAGVTLLQYRDKSGSSRRIIENAASIRALLAGRKCTLVMNDRADLAMLAGWDGVHVGQGDLSPEDARLVVGAGMFVGVSTHSDEQVRLAESSAADYVAVGPVFATGSKADAEPVIGLEGLRRARSLTTKSLVAIGGVTPENARSVIDAGADSVAVISALLVEGETVEKVTEDFLELLR